MASKILIVDDSVSMRQMVSYTLKENGFEVTEADNGKNGLSQAASINFDLIISDINMPVMDGIAMLKELRATDKNKFVPVLLLTTESGADKKSEGKAAGATGWLVKPFNPDTLIATVKKVLH
ncbi:MAG: response regulator [Gammaproteobacteria bacterium]